MNTSLLLVAVLATLTVTDAFLFSFFDRNNWNGLKVKFGLNPFDKYNFDSLPRTLDEATEDGFTKLSDCKDTDSFRGNRYIKDGDHGLVLLYDSQGFIAGIQAGIGNEQSNGYPFDGVKPPFIQDGDYSYITAYFVEPSTICTTGRTKQQFDQSGTGNNLYIQNGTNPDTEYMAIPRNEKDISQTKWAEGKCFPGMGRHYWYALREDMDCKTYFPVFLLYSRGNLNGFGWAFLTPLTSQRFEHPQPAQFGTFMKEVPKCLSQMGTISTMHIYMTATPRLNFC